MMGKQRTPTSRSANGGGNGNKSLLDRGNGFGSGGGSLGNGSGGMRWGNGDEFGGGIGGGWWGEDQILLSHLPVDFQQLLRSPDDPPPPPPSTEPHKKAKREIRNDGGILGMEWGVGTRHEHQPNFIKCGTNIISSIWSEGVAPIHVQEEWRCGGGKRIWSNMEKGCGEVIGQNLGREKSRGGDLLNHHRETSGFAKVAPGTAGGIGDGRRKGGAAPLPPSHFPSHFSPSPQLSGDTKNGTVKNESDQQPEEEDLLTSMKTHFRPIPNSERQVNKESFNSDKCSLGGCEYIDGTTFLVSASLEEVNYQRSSSGGLYLGPECKYMEYKQGGDLGFFVPKFKVSRSEKFCQTEEEKGVEDDGLTTAWTPEAGEEIEKEENEEEEGFYFPGDDRLAEDMVKDGIVEEEKDVGVIEEGEKATRAAFVGGWLAAAAAAAAAAVAASTHQCHPPTPGGWPISSLGGGVWCSSSTSTDTPSSWGTKTPTKKPWLLESVSVGGGMNIDHRLQLKKELTVEGEALLSDLSSIHLLLSSPPSSRPAESHETLYAKRMKIRPCPFKGNQDAYIQL